MRKRLSVGSSVRNILSFSRLAGIGLHLLKQSKNFDSFRGSNFCFSEIFVQYLLIVQLSQNNQRYLVVIEEAILCFSKNACRKFTDLNLVKVIRDGCAS